MISLLNLFNPFVPRQENAFWPLNVRINDTVRSFLLLLTSRARKSDSPMNLSLRYCGARSFEDLYIILDVSFTIIFLMDNQPSSLRSGIEGA